MKKNNIIIAIAVLAIIAAMLTGCATSVKQDLTNYLSQFSPIAELDANVRELFNSTVQENYVDDATMISNLLDSVIPASDSLVESVDAMTVETEEIRALHAKYLEAVIMQNEGFGMMAEALQNADIDTLMLANDMVADSEAMVDSFVEAIAVMATEYGLD